MSFVKVNPCIYCNGSGRINGYPCGPCGSTGVYQPLINNGGLGLWPAGTALGPVRETLLPPIKKGDK